MKKCRLEFIACGGISWIDLNEERKIRDNAYLSLFKNWCPTPLKSY